MQKNQENFSATTMYCMHDTQLVIGNYVKPNPNREQYHWSSETSETSSLEVGPWSQIKAKNEANGKIQRENFLHQWH